MIAHWRAVTVFLLSLSFGVVDMSVEGKEAPKQPLVLRAHLDRNKFDVDTELQPVVSLVNVSGKTLKLEYLKPSIMVPDIWDAVSNERILNAPTYVFDQICAKQETVLAANEEIELFSMPILIAKQSPRSSRTDHLQAFWATLPGSFNLRYSVQLKNFLPGASGELKAKDLEITVIDPSKELGGLLSFEHGRGYYLSLGTKGGKGSVWLQISENKVLAQKLEGLLGREIKVLGRLQRMPANIRASIPAGALYFTDFQIK